MDAKTRLRELQAQAVAKEIRRLRSLAEERLAKAIECTVDVIWDLGDDGVNLAAAGYGTGPEAELGFWTEMSENPHAALDTISAWLPAVRAGHAGFADERRNGPLSENFGYSPEFTPEKAPARARAAALIRAAAGEIGADPSPEEVEAILGRLAITF
jgi:hypothetical protein